MRANTDYCTSRSLNSYALSTHLPTTSPKSTTENQTSTHPTPLAPNTPPPPLRELPEDQLLTLLNTSSTLPLHSAILEKTATAITQKSEEKALQLALSNDNPLPDLPLITSDQASVIIKDLSKQIRVNIPEINYCVEFTPLEFFFYLLEKTSESDSRLPEVLDIEYIGYHVPSLLPGIAEQMVQTLLKKPSYSLPQNVIKNLEGEGDDLGYRIQIPLSKIDFFKDYPDMLVRFLSEKAILQNNLDIPLPKVEEFLTNQCVVHLPKILYNNCYASISIPNQNSQVPYKLVIAQHMGESNLLKNTINLSIKDLIKELKNLQNHPQTQTSFNQKAPSLIHLTNDAQNFWNAQFDRLPKPIPTPETIPHLEARKKLFDTAIHLLARKELWLACVDRLTGRLHINEPIYSENQYAGWLQLIRETLNGACPASPNIEKRLVEASFNIIETKEVSHPLEIQKELNECSFEKQWESLTISFLKTICANNFELSVAMLIQTCIALQHHEKGKDLIVSLWANMSSHLAAIQPKNNSNTSYSIWTHIYEIMSQEDKPFDAVVALLKTHAFLSLSQETTDSEIKSSLCLYERKPAFRITDGVYCLHLLTNADSFWETFHAHTKTIESNEKFNEISSLTISKKIPETNNAISRNKELLSLDYSAIHKTVETFISSTKSPYWQIFAIKTLLAFHTLDATLLPWKTTQLILQTLSSMEENPEQQELINKTLHLSTLNKYAHTEIPSELLWACALLKNIDPKNYQKDVLQAYSLWTSYEKTAKPFDDKTLEIEVLIKIAAYRPDLAANIFQKLFTKDFFDLPLHEQKVKEYITSICRSLETSPTHKNEKTHLSLQNIVDTFQNASINTWMFKQLMIGTDSCSVLSEKTMNLLLKTFPYADLNNRDIALKHLTEDKLKQFLELVTSSHLKDSVILDCLSTIFTLRKSLSANTKVFSDFDKKLIRTIIHYASITQSHASLLLKASQLATASNEPSLSTQATFFALAIEHASNESPFLLLEEFKKAHVEEQQKIVKQILDSPKKEQAFEVQLLLTTATCRPDLAAEMFLLLLNKNFFRRNLLKNEIQEYVSSLCQSLKTSPSSHAEKLYLTLQKIIDIFPFMKTHVFGQLLINTASDVELPPKTRELLLKTLPYTHMTDADLSLKSISIDKLEQLVEGIPFSNQNSELRFASLDNLLTLRGSISDHTEQSSALDKKLIEMILHHANLTPSHCSLLVKASQRAADSNLLSLSSQAVLTAMKIGGTFEENHLLSSILLNNFEKGSLEEQQTLIKQILNAPNAQKILESTFKESFAVFFNPSLLQSFIATFAKDRQQQPLARQFFKFLIQLCKLNGATDNYRDLLPLAHVCLLDTPSSKSAFRKCLYEFRPELLAAASTAPVDSSKLIAFFKKVPVSMAKDPVKKASLEITQDQLATIVSNENELIRFLQPFTHDFNKFLKSISVNKFINPLCKVPIDTIFISFAKIIFKLSKTENKDLVPYAIDMWNHIESLFIKKIKITPSSLTLYKALLSGLKNPEDFDKHLKEFLSQLEKYTHKDIYKTFNKDFFESTSYLPLDIQEKYIQALADTYIPLFIGWHKALSNSLKIPFYFLIEIGQKIPENTYLKFIEKLKPLKTPQAFSHMLCLTEGFLKSQSELPSDVLEKISVLLKDAPFSTAHFLIPCLRAGKDTLPEEIKLELWKNLLEITESKLKETLHSPSQFRTICQIYFDLIINYAAQFPVDIETAKNLLYYLSYICIDDEQNFHSQYIDKAIRFCTNTENFKSDSCPTLTPQAIRLDILQNMLNQPVCSPQLLARMFKNALECLKHFPNEPLNNSQLIEILYALCKRNVSDSCFILKKSNVREQNFNVRDHMYNVYHNSFNDLAKELIKRTDPSQETITMPYIAYLILNAEMSDSIDPEFIKKAIGEYLKATKFLYETTKMTNGFLNPQGYLYFRRLKAIAEHGIGEEIFNEENYCLLLDIADSIMEIAYDYPPSSDFFAEMSKAAIELITKKIPSTMGDYNELKNLSSKWHTKLDSLKGLPALKIKALLLEKTISTAFNFNINILTDDLDELQSRLQIFHELLTPISPKIGIQEVGYQKMFSFSSFIIPDSFFTDMHNINIIEKEYAAFNQIVTSIITKISTKGNDPWPPILALLYRLEKYDKNSSADLPKQINAYFNCLENNYSLFKEQNNSKHGGYILFKRLSTLLINCSLKKIPLNTPEQYSKMKEFLETILKDYTNIPTIHSHMKSILQMINKIPQPTV